MTKRARSSETPHSDLKSTTAPEPTSLTAGEISPFPQPQFALASNGRIIVSTAELAGRDLSKREVFIGVYLTLDEQREVMGFLDNAAADAAARITAKVPRGGSGNNPLAIARTISSSRHRPQHFPPA